MSKGGTLFQIVVTTLFVGTNVVFAAYPDTPYSPGETLSPSCAPGSENCTVSVPAASGANSDITSLSGLSTSLSVAQGGTGTTSLSSLLTSLLPSQTGNSGEFLTTNGSHVSWGLPSSRSVRNITRKDS